MNFLKILKSLVFMLILFEGCKANFWDEKHAWNYTGWHVTNLANILDSCANFIDHHRYGQWYPDWVSTTELFRLLRDKNRNGDSFRGGNTIGTDDEARCAANAIIPQSCGTRDGFFATNKAIERLRDVAGQMRTHSGEQWYLSKQTMQFHYK